MNKRLKFGVAAAALVMSVAAYAAEPVMEITLPGQRLFTESITSTKDGALYVGSVGKGNVSRIAYGSTNVTEFIPHSALGDVYGLYADEKHNTLWVCSDKTMAGEGESALKSFDLKTGAAKGSYPLPGPKPFCNDIATAEDGTAYVTDTPQAWLLALKPGASQLEIVSKDPLFAGADGLAFSDKRTLIVNSVSLGKLIRVALGKDGKPTSVTELKLSAPLVRPDGLRTVSKNKLVQAENGGDNEHGRVEVVTISEDGTSAQIDFTKSGMASTPAVTATRGYVWVAEGKLSFRKDPASDPGTFKLYAVKLPK